jgi:hypothetical protein
MLMPELTGVAKAHGRVAMHLIGAPGWSPAAREERLRSGWARARLLGYQTARSMPPNSNNTRSID